MTQWELQLAWCLTWIFAFHITVTVVLLLMRVICTALFAKQPRGSSARHHDLIDLVTRSFVSAGFPVTKAGCFERSLRETTRWSHTGPMTERQVVMLGRHSDLTSGWFICERSSSSGRFDPTPLCERYRLEINLYWEFPWVPSVSWDSHWKGNR